MVAAMFSFGNRILLYYALYCNIFAIFFEYEAKKYSISLYVLLFSVFPQKIMI